MCKKVELFAEVVKLQKELDKLYRRETLLVGLAVKKSKEIEEKWEEYKQCSEK